MQRKWQHLLLFSLLTFTIYQPTLAENEKVEIKSGTNKYEDLVFSVPQNNQYTSELLVINKSEENLDLVLYISPEKQTPLVEAIKQKTGNDLFLNTFFYADAPPTKYQEELKDNEGEIAILCNKYKNSKDKAIANWCKGGRTVTLSISKGESKRIPFTINISEDAQEQESFILAILKKRRGDKTETVLARATLTYKIPDPNEDREKVLEKKELDVKFDSFSFQRSLNWFNLSEWLNIGKQEECLANFSVVNNENLPIETEYFVKVNPFFSDEKIYTKKVILPVGENKVDLKVGMPFLGKVKIIGGIKFGKDAMKKEILTNEVRIFIFPVREVFFLTLFLLLTLLLMWRKKKKLCSFLDGKEWIKYRIQEGDNVVNLAFAYGVSWKELASYNKIKPPYTLTPRSVIMIPPRLKKVFKHTLMQNKNYFDNQNQSSDDQNSYSDLNSSTHKTSFSTSSNIIQEENFSGSSSNYSQNNLEKKRYMDNIRSVDIQNQPNKHHFSQQQNTNSDRNYDEGDVISNSNLNDDPNFRQVKQKNVNKEVVILPKFITDKAENNGMSNRNNNLMPVRRNMDIRWMHEDNEAYDEAMYDEVKAINFKIKMILLVVVALLGLSGYWAFNYFQNNNVDEETASINDLLAQDVSTTVQTDNSREEIEKTDEGRDDEKDKEDESSSTDAKTPVEKSLKNPQDITVQVLNGGAKSGTATKLTNLFKEKNYSIKVASNANNKVDGVVIYYEEELKDEAKKLSEIVTDYDNIELVNPDEETEVLLKKHNADIVVVAGK